MPSATTSQQGLPSLTFHGAAGTVTGSRYSLKTNNNHVLIDCGLFQGLKELRLRNWQAFPEPADSFNAIFLTHAHIDHSGYLPALVRQGFKGPIFCTAATFDLCQVLLLDAAKIQEEDANYHNRHNISKHKPALPLYTTEDAKRALDLFEVADDNHVDMGDIQVQFHSNGHILGSSFLDVTAQGKHILFSGDVGRPHDAIMHTPSPPCYADYLVIESTYGDRLHPKRDIKECLADSIGETLRGGGDVLIPAFAVGRAQLVLYYLHQLRAEQRVPPVPIYLDSPMAIKATKLMERHHQDHRLSPAKCRAIEDGVYFVETIEQSMALNHLKSPSIIVSASGMASGGRVLFHLKRMLPDSKNTVIFAGFQAAGTRGDKLVRGEDKIKIHDHYYPVKATIENMDFLSAHADRDELLHWLRKMPVAPKQCIVTHGEPSASQAMSEAVQNELGWKTVVPSLGETIAL